MNSPAKNSSLDVTQRTQRRIGGWTLVFGLTSAIAVLFSGFQKAAAGVAIGTFLAWLNMRWMAGGLSALGASARAQAGSEMPRVSFWVYFKFFSRYFLIAAVVYVMMTRFAVPAASIIGGLLSLGAATIAVSFWELKSRPHGTPH
jgi:hypothetical protein